MELHAPEKRVCTSVSGNVLVEIHLQVVAVLGADSLQHHQVGCTDAAHEEEGVSDAASWSLWGPSVSENAACDERCQTELKLVVCLIRREWSELVVSNAFLSVFLLTAVAREAFAASVQVVI